MHAIKIQELAAAAVVAATQDTDTPDTAALIADPHYRDMYERLAVQLLSLDSTQSNIVKLGLTDKDVVSQTATYILWKAAEAHLSAAKKGARRKNNP